MMKHELAEQDIQVMTLREAYGEQNRVHCNETCHFIFFNMDGDTELIHGAVSTKLKEGEIVSVPPGTDYRISKSSEGFARKESILIFFSRAFWQSLLGKDPELDFIFRTFGYEGVFVLRSPEATWQGLYAAVYLLLEESRHTKLCRKSAVESLFTTVMVHMNRTVYFQNLRTDRKMDDEILMKDMMNYVLHNFSEKISLETMSGIFHVSRSRITHLFKEKQGISFYQFVLQRRLIFAKNAILSGKPISEVAISCGFTEYTTFYKAFCKNYGMSPKEMQKSVGARRK